MGWKSKVVVVSLSAWALLCAPALAAESEPLNLPAPETSKPVAVDSGSYLIKTLIALAIVIAVIWVAYKLLKKLNFRSSGSGRGPAVEVISRTQLDREMSIYVLRLGNQISVVSRSGGGSAVMSTMDELEASELGLLSSVNPSDQRLKSVFSELRSRVKPSKATAEPVSVDELLGGQSLDTYVGGMEAASIDELLAEGEAASVDELLAETGEHSSLDITLTDEGPYDWSRS